MKLKLPATNLSYVILCVKYMLDGEECACNMHMLNDNKMGEVEIDTPDGGIVTTVTMNEVTDAQKVVSIQVLYNASKEEHKPEPKLVPESGLRLETTPISSNLKVETKVEATVERKAEPKKEDHAVTHSKRETKKQETSRGKEGKEEKS